MVCGDVVSDVHLYKPHETDILGITLVSQGSCPVITALKANCIAANSGRISVGQRLFAVNGVAVCGAPISPSLFGNIQMQLQIGEAELWSSARGRGRGLPGGRSEHSAAFGDDDWGGGQQAARLQ